MKLTNKQILHELHPSLTSLSKIQLKGVGVEDIMKIARNLKGANRIVEEINSAKDIIFQKHCEKNEDGTPIVRDGKFAMTDEFTAQKELLQLLEKKSELKIEKINESIFNEVSSLTAEIMLGLICILD
jgi:hypothetical protein